MLRFPLFVMLCLTSVCAAQIPYNTIPDTAQMRKMRTEKVEYRYTISQPYDSVTGQLKKNGRIDTSFSHYDHSGLEIEFGYINKNGSHAHGVHFFDGKGRIVRSFSYDDDSTNGFLDYWTYDENGRVIKEISVVRKGSEEEPFGLMEFFYDDQGKLIMQKDYSYDGNGKKELRETAKFIYNADGSSVKVGFHETGDTSYVDSLGSPADYGNYYSRRYTYYRTLAAVNKDGKMKTEYVCAKKLVSNYKTNTDTLGMRIRYTMVARYYSYYDGKLNMMNTDTTYSNLQGHMIESRTEKSVTKYFYDDNGNLDYAIQYNRNGEPIVRRTWKYVYYK